MTEQLSLFEDPWPLTQSMDLLSFTVKGIPGAQGSKQGFAISRKGADGSREFTGKVAQVESSKKVAPWRADVRKAAEDAMPEGFKSFDGPCYVVMLFTMTRPKSHYRTGRNAHLLKDSAPKYVTSSAAGDLDKLVRSTSDALTSAGVWLDDSLMVRLTTDKQYDDFNGVKLTVGRLE